MWFSLLPISAYGTVTGLNMVAVQCKVLGESPEATEACSYSLCHGFGVCAPGSAAAATSRLIHRTGHRSRNKVDVDLHPGLETAWDDARGRLSSSGVLVFDLHSPRIDWRTI